ncbi:MAG: mechanosensitive ion channel [Saprospiraceae bacterium]|nr:mechanosensitive ion channel [Saprospiraceae bacterium]
MIFLFEINALKIVEELLLDFAAVVPNLLGALLVLVVGWLVSKLLAGLVRRLFRGLGVDRLAGRLNDIDLVSKVNIKLTLSKFLARLTYYVLLFIFIIAATDVLGMPSVSEMMSDILNYIPYLVSALIVFVIGLVLADFVKNIVKTACDSLAIPASGLISNIIFYFLFLNIAMISLSQARIDTGFIEDNISIILGGLVLAFAIGYGLAARPLVASLLSAYYNKDKVKVGDIIEIEGIKGEVRGLDNYSIIIQTEDSEVVVPLNKLQTEKYHIFR